MMDSVNISQSAIYLSRIASLILLFGRPASMTTRS
jgi:hypothetical protein